MVDGLTNFERSAAMRALLPGDQAIEMLARVFPLAMRPASAAYAEKIRIMETALPIAYRMGRQVADQGSAAVYGLSLLAR